MKAAACAIIEQAEIVRDFGKINALDSPHDRQADAVPEIWTPEHVGRRILEAFETLSRLPPDRGPRKPGNCWPPYVYDWADRLAQEEMSEREKQRRRQERNRDRERPTSEDLRRMEVALSWLGDLAKIDEGLCRAVQRWARLRSTGRSVKGWCARTGLSFQIFYRRRDRGIALIIAKIDATPVW